jgi:peptidylprolyl isomerase
MRKTTVYLYMFCLLALFFASCVKKVDASGSERLDASEIDKLLKKLKGVPSIPVGPNEMGYIKTNYGTIKIKFYTDKAPKTCASFKRLANSGFYNGTTFHRVVPGFVIQGGDILSRDVIRANDGTGDPGFTVDAEISDLKHKKGSLSMARLPSDLNSASSQFFICLENLPNLDGGYTVFAEVAEGLDIVDRIATAQRDGRDNPLERIEMIKVWVK